MWIQQVVFRSKRQGRSVLEYLQDVTIKTAGLWVNNLLRSQAAHLLQQSKLYQGDIVSDGAGGYMTLSDKRPVHMLEEVNDSYILKNFQKTFMLNRQDKTEQHLLALFAGTACKQGPGDSVSDYLLAFEAAGWQAAFDPKANKNHTITLIHMGLNPVLQKAGIRDKVSLSVFETVEKYKAFLLQEEMKLGLSPTSATPSTFPHQAAPSAFPRPFGPGTHRVNQVSTVDPDASDVWDDMESGEDGDGDGDDDDWDVDADGGRVCGVRSARPGGRGRPVGKTPRGNYASKPPAANITVPGPNGAQGVTKPLSEYKLYFNFPTPDAIWPTGFTFTAPSPDITPRTSNMDRIMITVRTMDPAMSQARTHTVLTKLRDPSVDPTWRWCAIHASTAHSTLDCPCVHAICPRQKKP
jgi:hypothetical protein